MRDFPLEVWGAAVAGLIAVGLFGWVLITPSSTVPTSRRRRGATEQAGAVSAATSGVVSLVARALDGGGRGRKMAYALDRAGVRRPPAEFVVITVGLAIAAFAFGFFIAGPLLAILLMVLTPMLIFLIIVIRSDRRKAAFAEDLEDILSLLATNLRAGHSLVQSLDSVAQEVDDPAKAEIARIVNQVRIGRDLGDAANETADRMDSEEFRWVAQAIAIHRQVGGNLGEVLDTIGVTIRERGRIRRQVKALSAEGRLSAWVLLALPVVVALALTFMNPDYIGVLTASATGVLLIIAAIVLMALGGLWLRKAIEVKF